MGKADPGYKRFGILLIVLIFMIFLYSTKSVLLDQPTQYDELTESTITQAEANKGGLGIFEAVEMIIGFAGFLVGMFFFEIPNLSWFFVVFLTPIYILFLFTFWYLVIDWAYDIYDATWIG